MNISSYNVRVNVDDSNGRAWFDVDRFLGGFGVKISFLPETLIYLARRKDDPMLHLIIVPSETWTDSIKDNGYDIVGKLFYPTNPCGVEE